MMFWLLHIRGSSANLPPSAPSLFLLHPQPLPLDWLLPLYLWRRSRLSYHKDPCFFFFVCLFFFSCHIAQHVGSSLPNQGLNLCLLQWKWGVFTTGPLGKCQGPFLILLHIQLGFFHQVTPKQVSSWVSDSHCCSGHCNLASISALSFTASANVNSDLLIATLNGKFSPCLICCCRNASSSLSEALPPLGCWDIAVCWPLLSI